MEFKKEFLEMTKGELILYFNLLSDGGDGERVVNRYDYEDMGFKESTFYDSRKHLIDKGILRKIRKDTFFFTTIKWGERKW